VTVFAGWALCELCLANAMRDPVALAYGVRWFTDRTQQLVRGCREGRASSPGRPGRRAPGRSYAVPADRPGGARRRRGRAVPGAYLLALGCLVAVAAAGALAVSLYGQLHQEALQRDARARAARPVADPFTED
jgi:hypothetical protein